MKTKKLGLAAASLLGAATMLAGASPAHADDVCIACPTGPGADPVGKLDNVLFKITDVQGKWGPDETPFLKLQSPIGKITDAMLKISGKY